MNKKAKRNISGLLQHAASKKNETTEKVNQAIDTLKRSKSKKINFKTVSALSGVSTTTLYNNPVLCERIRSLRAIEKHPLQINLLDDNRDDIRLLKQEIQKLQNDKKLLVAQLVEIERIKDENQRLKILIGKNNMI